MALKKSEETRERILAAALETFRERGFARATMREVAEAAGVATGAAYYYFASKEAMVMAFYEQAQEQMRPKLAQVVEQGDGLEERVRAIIEYKLEYFLPNRVLLGALSAHVDPSHPLSPFSEETRGVREQDLAFFARSVAAAKVKLPKDLLEYLPRLLWMYQMGLLLFWVYDRSAEQRRTKVLLKKTLKLIVLAIRLAGLPPLRPARRLALELLEVVYGNE